MAQSSQRGKNNNNPEGHNQYTKGGLTEKVKSHPIASAAIAGATAAAGAFLWSKRSQIGEKASAAGGKISEKASAAGDRISGWAEEMRSSKVDDGTSSSARRSSSTGSESLSQSALGSATAMPSGKSGSAQPKGQTTNRAQSTALN